MSIKQPFIVFCLGMTYTQEIKLKNLPFDWQVKQLDTLFYDNENHT